MAASRFVALLASAVLGGCLGVYEPAVGPTGCDAFDQDCDGDRKCVLADTDEDEMIDETVCIELAGDLGPGSTCQPMEFPEADDCAADSNCFVYEEALGTGVCAPWCAESGGCPDTDQLCLFDDSEEFGSCIRQCDPLDAGACNPQQFFGCYPLEHQGAWYSMCLPRFDDRQPGESCTSHGQCNTGSLCAPEGDAVSCAGGGPGCCAVYCNVNEDGGCSDGTSCVALEAMGITGAGSLGACVAN